MEKELADGIDSVVVRELVSNSVGIEYRILDSLCVYDCYCFILGECLHSIGGSVKGDAHSFCLLFRFFFHYFIPVLLPFRLRFALVIPYLKENRDVDEDKECQ